VVVKTSRSKDPEVMGEIALLSNHPGMLALIDEVTKAREKYFTNFARGMAQSTEPADQREIDYKRGFWQGALYALHTFPQMTRADWDKYVRETEKESETA